MKRGRGLCLLALLLLVTACGAKEETASKKLNLPAEGLTKLVIAHRNGDIHLVGNPDLDTIEVSAEIKAKGIKMEKLTLELEAREETAYLDARFRGQFLASGSGTVDLEIAIPERFMVDIESHRDGEIRISDLSSSAKIANINGRIEVVNLAGALEVDNRDGDVTVRDIGSDVEIANVNGHLVVNQVRGSAKIELGDGSLELDNVEKDVTLSQSGNGKVTIGEVKGKLTQRK
ncbi:hypothetical protein [Gorillibacterium sp. CAU 1737]|uniref:hypothetical protein n=1 Tax=Gorillibacterium sp. CAU 1737 TaxID=3140362 RepID=UPI0032611FA1